MGDEIHMGGLLSGIDVQGLIDKLLKIEADKIDDAQDVRVDIEADVAAWSDISGDMTALSDSLDALRSWSTWSKMESVSNDETRMTATATSSAVDAVYDVTITRLANAHSIASDKAATLTGTPTDDASTDLVAAGVLTAGETFTIEGQVVTISATESLTTLAQQINTVADSMADADKVTATLIDNQLVVTRDNTGAIDISITDTSGTPLEDIGLLTGGAVKNELVLSQDALFNVNGIDVNRDDNTGLDDVISNVTLNLTNTAGVSDNLELSISHDTATPMTAIQSFLDTYNAAVVKMEAYIHVQTGSGGSEPRVSILQGDTMVGSILRNMRKIFSDVKSSYMDSSNAEYTYDGRTGVMDSLQDVGIWTLGREHVVGVEDSARLSSMLQNNFDLVEQLFRGVDGGSGLEGGVADDLYAYSHGQSKAMTGQIAQRIFRLEDKVTDHTKRVDKMLDDLELYEKNLWTQFTAMEDAIARSQSDLSFLTSKLG